MKSLIWNKATQKLSTESRFDRNSKQTANGNHNTVLTMAYFNISDGTNREMKTHEEKTRKKIESIQRQK